MNALDYPPPVLELIAQLKKLPSIGPRSAERMALWLLTEGKSHSPLLASSLHEAHQNIRCCPDCGFFSQEGLCSACSDPSREHSCICVVEHATDILPIERCGIYRGMYHCLGGRLSPLDGIMPEDLQMDSLLRRVHDHPHCEVILAMGSDVEGDATALYLSEILKPFDCQVTRLAQGMPAGSGLGHTDALTLMRAIQGRTLAK